MIRSRIIQNSGGCRRSQTAWLAGGGGYTISFGAIYYFAKKKKKKKKKKKFGKPQRKNLDQ